MRRWYWGLLVASSIACAGLTVACGDDDDNPNTPTDGGPINNPEGSTVDGPVTPPTEGGVDGGCTFATYVIGLVNTQTNATAKPDTTLGAGCKDTTTQAEFKPLFP